MKRQPVLHPFFLALYPVTTLLAINWNQVIPAEAGRPLILILGATLVLLILTRLLTGDWGRAGLITSLWLLIFFGYGHLLRLLNDNLAVDKNSLNRILASLSAALLILGTWAIWRLWRRDVSNLTTLLNVVIGVALALSLLNIGPRLLAPGSESVVNAQEPLAVATAVNEQPPDIYFIVTDAYTRADVLAELFQYDNTEFIDFLEGHDFYVAGQSHSNYAQTFASLSSTFNYEYVNHLGEEVGYEAENRAHFRELVHNNKFRQFLEGQGYQTISIASGMAITEWHDAAVFMPSGAANGLTNFEILLLADTLPGTLFPLEIEFEIKRQQVYHVFDSLTAAASLPGPKFVVAHILSPHIPIVFGPDGEPIDPSQEYDLNALLETGISRDQYIRAYGGEVTYLNSLFRETISEILAESKSPPIIIIQGDHGSRAFLDWSSAENTCMFERMSILNAYHLPGLEDELLYENISPVNTFRVILSAYFGADIELLPDESYFALWDRPYDQIKVTDRLGESCQP